MVNDLQEAESNQGNFLGSMRYDEGYLDGLKDANDYIIQVEHKSKIKVPEFVDKWMRKNSSIGWWRTISQWEEEVPEKDKEVYNWYQDYNEDNFIVAWITGDYEVLKEDCYFAELKSLEFSELNKAENLSRTYYWVIEKALDFEGEGFYVWPTPVKTMAGVFNKREWNKMGINDSNADFIKFVGGSDD